MTFDGGSLWRCLLISLFGELGDKTFWITAIIAAWCPWQGIRKGDQALGERCLVLAGATVALAVRAILIGSLTDPKILACWYDAFACGILALLGAKAAAERSYMAEGAPQQEEAAKAAPAGAGAEAAAAEPEWNKSAFSNAAAPPAPAPPKDPNPFAAEAAEAAPPAAVEWNKSAFAFCPSTLAESEPEKANYGTLAAPPPRSADGVLSKRISDTLASQILAFPAALVAVFLVEADDKSEAALLLSGRRGSEMVIGAIIGFLPSVMLAVFFGFLLERQLGARQALLPVTFLLLALSLVSLSQALLQLRVLQPVKADTAQEHNATLFAS
mmetsp:Transcript_28377/g.90308  ORF Transcript_28377/g.90308 Transcript_28377/m.90308 type:complete len:328 (+) Transcript_28377:64-1047(+)